MFLQVEQKNQAGAKAFFMARGYCPILPDPTLVTFLVFAVWTLVYGVVLSTSRVEPSFLLEFSRNVFTDNKIECLLGFSKLIQIDNEDQLS